MLKPYSPNKLFQISLGRKRLSYDSTQLVTGSDTLVKQFPDRASDGVATNCVVCEVLGVSTGGLAGL